MQQIGIHLVEDHPRVRYTVVWLDRHPLCRRAGLRFQINNDPVANALNLWYGESPAPPVIDYLIPAQGIYFGPSAAPGPFQLNRYDFAGKEVYSVERKLSALDRPLLRDRQFQFDLLETFFFHISRYEEVFADPRQHSEAGWLEETDHLLVRQGLQGQPVVDQLVAALVQVLTGKQDIAVTTYALSHDVDFLYRYPTLRSLLWAMGGAAVRGEGPAAVGRHWRTYRDIQRGRSKDPYDCFDWLLSTEERWRQQTLYLMAGGETPYDNHYPIEHPRVRSLIDAARVGGYTIGLHPSYNAAMKPELFAAEQAKLEAVSGQQITHSRQHWLRFDWARTPAILTRQGISEDASLGYRRHIGFRAGTGFPYHLYDFEQEAPFRWREHPLALMESAALHEARRLQADPVALMREFLEQNRQGTHISLNFHNSNFDPMTTYGDALADFYRRVVLQLPLGGYD